MGRKRALRIRGVLMLVLSFLWAVLLYLLNRILVASEYQSAFAYFFRSAFQPAYPQGLVLIALGCLLISCCWRRDVLIGKAAELGDYASDLERDIARRNAIYDQWENRSAPAQTEEPPREAAPAADPAGRAGQLAQVLSTPAAPEPAPSAEAVPAGSGEPLDLNTCSRDELSALPGVGIAGAMRAMNLRQERGGFASVDEFVDLLGIKPHFAVQLFERATVSRPVQAAQKSPVPARRRIDL
jgi:DNA uptake protein ComE-like DNA-binding protein